MTRHHCSTPPPAATPGRSTTWPSRHSSPPTPPANPSSTSKPPAPPSPKSPTPDRHLTGTSPTATGAITTNAPQPPRLRGSLASPHRHRERLLRRHLQRRATPAGREGPLLGSRAGWEARIGECRKYG